MEVQINIDPTLDEPKIVVHAREINDELKQILDTLSSDSNKVISGFDGNKYEILDMSELVRIYASSSKVLAQSISKTYVVNFRLYELENLLDKTNFVRISKSEIINLKMVKNFDLSITGTICVNLKNNEKSYVSRRYVTKIKEKLGV